MANTAGFFGFSQYQSTSGPVNFSYNSNPPYRIAAGNSTAIFYGDLVRFTESSPTGFITQWTAGDGATSTRIPVGIFIGCSYFSTARQQHTWNRYWPGSDATGDVNAWIVDDPNSLWKVQANVGPITQTSFGLNADIASTPAGNTTTGISGMSLAAPTTTTTLPFKVVNFINAPPGANGTDITTANNYVVVSFNNQLFKTTAVV